MTSMPWESEKLYHDADLYFYDLLTAIKDAKETITLESFIFARDLLGMKICQALCEAAQRGVKVRLLIDGVGSSHWFSSFYSFVKDLPLEVRFYHPLPWHPKPIASCLFKYMTHYLLGLEWINKRNHRKACVIDGKYAFVGSFNITTDHLKSIGPKAPWRDSGIKLRGEQVKDISLAFERAWLKFPSLAKKRSVVKRLHNFQRRSSLVRLNDTPQMRKLYHKDLRVRLKYATTRIWITNPYFVPDSRMIELLQDAQARGVDVRLILPELSDMSLFPWINSWAARKLAKSGVKIYYYKERILHAKIVIIDDWSMLGSSNLNSRSLLHDLEMDIVLSSSKSREELKNQFLLDQQTSDLQIYEAIIKRYWSKNLFFPFLRLIRYWI